MRIKRIRGLEWNPVLHIREQETWYAHVPLTGSFENENVAVEHRSLSKNGKYCGDHYECRAVLMSIIESRHNSC